LHISCCHQGDDQARGVKRSGDDDGEGIEEGDEEEDEQLKGK
jgi:hypothetical protein